MSDFDLFGSDSDGESASSSLAASAPPTSTADAQAYLHSRALLNEAKSKVPTTTPSPAAPSPPSPAALIEIPQLPDLFPFHPPRYYGPCVLHSAASSIGGGREYIASSDLPPGTLLMMEEPIASWPGSSTAMPICDSFDPPLPGDYRLLEAMYRRTDADDNAGRDDEEEEKDTDTKRNRERRKAEERFEDMKALHPTDLATSIPNANEIVPQFRMGRYEKFFRKMMQDTTIVRRPKDEEEMLRLLFVIRCNGKRDDGTRVTFVYACIKLSLLFTRTQI